MPILVVVTSHMLVVASVQQLCCLVQYSAFGGSPLYASRPLDTCGCPSRADSLNMDEQECAGFLA